MGHGPRSHRHNGNVTAARLIRPRFTTTTGGRYDLAAAEERLEGFRAWLEEWWPQAELDYKWWFLTQLRRCFEEYDQRLSADKKDANAE